MIPFLHYPSDNSATTGETVLLQTRLRPPQFHWESGVTSVSDSNNDIIKTEASGCTGSVSVCQFEEPTAGKQLNWFPSTCVSIPSTHAYNYVTTLVWLVVRVCLSKIEIDRVLGAALGGDRRSLCRGEQRNRQENTQETLTVTEQVFRF